MTGVISSALRYLKSTLRSQTNVYLMALTAYSLVVGNDIEAANFLLQKLEKEAYVKGKSGSQRMQKPTDNIMSRFTEVLVV